MRSRATDITNINRLGWIQRYGSQAGAGHALERVHGAHHKGVWRVLPVWEFFMRLGFTNPAKIPRAYIKTLFQCIQDTPALHRLLVDMCDDVDGWLETNRQLFEKHDFTGENFLMDRSIDWSYGSRTISRGGIFRGTQVESFHRCIEEFSFGYAHKDRKTSVEGKYWSKIITLLYMGTYAQHGIESKIEFICLGARPVEKDDNTWLYHMFANADIPQVIGLIGLLYNQGNEETAIALFNAFLNGHLANLTGFVFKPCMYAF